MNVTLGIPAGFLQLSPIDYATAGVDVVLPFLVIVAMPVLAVAAIHRTVLARRLSKPSYRQAQKIIQRVLRPHSGDRSGTAPWAPPVQPTRRGLQPRRPGDRNRTTHQPRTALVLRPPDPPTRRQPTPPQTSDTQVNTTCTPQRSRATHRRQTPSSTCSTTAHPGPPRTDNPEPGGESSPEFLHPGAYPRSTSTPDRNHGTHEKSPPIRQNATIERF